MPALTLFGRRWLISSDDVPLPAAVCAAFHLVWSCLLVWWFISVHGPRECTGAYEHDIGVGGLLGSFALSFVLEVLLVRHGLRGGPFEASKRRLVPRLLYLDFASHVAQVAFNSFCTYLVYSAAPPVCPGGGNWDPLGAMLVLVWCTWALIAGLLTLMVLCYNLFPDYRDAASWEKRCNCLGTLLCCSRGHRGQYRDLSGKQQRLSSRLGNLFSMMLSHIDLSPSDILLAFSLAMMLQRIQRRQQREQQRKEGGSAGGGAEAVGSAGGPAAAAGEPQPKQQQPKQQQQSKQQQDGQGQRYGGVALGRRPSPSTAHMGSGIELPPSTQSSPQPASSVCSIDDLLSSLGAQSDLESGLGSGGGRRMGPSPSMRPLLSRQHPGGSSRDGRDGTGSQQQGKLPGGGGPGKAGWASGPYLESLGLGRLESFVPAHSGVGLGDTDTLQLGAEKTEEGPEGQPQRPDSRADELGPVDAKTLQEAAWACKYAFASYGMLLFIFSQPTTGCLQLCCGRNCGLLVGTARGVRARKKLDLRLLPNLNREATQQAAGLADADLLDVRYEGEVPHVLPYFLAVDKQERAVVLAIRGSLSLDDVVRDLLFEPASLDEWVRPGRRWEEPPPEILPASSSTRYAAHAGILEAARATFIDLQDHGVLQGVLLAPEGRCHGYRLVVTGHSLGAGCAFLLALYLRHFCPELRCWAFSPPGGLASGEVCAAAGEWCTSVVCGKEWIPRLSLRTFSRMRDEMVYAALRCRQPKWLVLLELVRGRRWKEDELFYRPEELTQEAREALRSYRESVLRSAALQSFLELSGDFMPPGRCFHLRPTGKVTGGGEGAARRLVRQRTKQRQYRAVYVDGGDIIDQGVMLSGRMMADHMPDYLLATLRSMTRSMRHSCSTATISDKAGERLTDQLFEHPLERQHSRGEGGGEGDNGRDIGGGGGGGQQGEIGGNGAAQSRGSGSSEDGSHIWAEPRGNRPAAVQGNGAGARGAAAARGPAVAVVQQHPPAQQALPRRAPPPPL